MRVVIFGATGGLGRQLVERGLAEEHVVTAFARSIPKLDAEAERLHRLAGNVLDPASVRAAVASQDAVICAIGVAPGKDPGRFYSEGTQQIVEAMQSQDIRRLICVSTWLVRESRRRAGPLVRIFVPLLQPRLFVDRERQEQVVRASGLNWTLVRPARLTNKPATGNYQVGTHLKLAARASISRADVADFLINQLADETYNRQAVTIRA